jgi:hypothetical protein
VPILRRAALHLGVLGSYVLLALALTYPVVLHPRSTIPIAHQIPHWVPGDGDPWQALWGFWFLGHSLATEGRIPLTTNLLFYPLGTDTAYVSLVLIPGLIALPLMAVAGLVATYNLLLVGALALAGYGAFLLVRRICRSAGPAFVGGLVFAFSPYHMAHSLEHVFLLTSTLWVPLYVLFLIRTLDDGGVGNTVVAALWLTLTAVSNPYYAIALAFFTALLVGARLLEAAWASTRWRVLRRLLGIVVTCLVPLGPWAIFAGRRLVGDAVLAPSLNDVNQWNADLLAFLVPSPLHPFWGALSAPIYERFTGNLFEQTVYLGYVALAVAGLAFAGCRRQARFWAASAAVFAVLSLGPLLHVGGRWLFERDGVPITLPLPAMLLHLLPLSSGLRVLVRFHVMVTLSLAILVGLGLAALREGRAPGPWRPVVTGILTGGLALMILVEYLSVPLPVLPTRIPSVFRLLRAEAVPGRSLLDVPLDWQIAKYQYYQTGHEKPLILGFVPRPAVSLIRQTEGVPFLDFFQRPDRLDPALTAGWDRRAALRVIDLLNLDTIVIHGEYLDQPTAERVGRVVMEHFPVAQVVEEERMRVMRLSHDHDRLALWTADAYDFDFGPSVPRFFVARGWWPSERAGSVGMAWSRGRESTLGFFLPEAWSMTMDLRLIPFSIPSAPPQRMTVAMNGRTLGEIELVPDTAWRTYSMSVPTTAVKPGINVVRFTYRYTAAPSVIIPGNPDTRELAVAFSRVTLKRN